MSFFIPGKTRCAIGGDELLSRADAAPLPQLDADTLQNLPHPGGRWVRRSTWDGWEGRTGVVESAIRVARLVTSAGPNRIIFDEDGLIATFSPSFRLCSIADLRVLGAVVMEPQKADILALGLVEERRAQMQLGAYFWVVSEGGRRFESRQEGEVIETFNLTEDRIALWRRALKTVAELDL